MQLEVQVPIQIIRSTTHLLELLRLLQVPLIHLQTGSKRELLSIHGFPYAYSFFSILYGIGVWYGDTREIGDSHDIEL
jgi:hypothetical protein